MRPTSAPGRESKILVELPRLDLSESGPHSTLPSFTFHIPHLRLPSSFSRPTIAFYKSVLCSIAFKVLFPLHLLISSCVLKHLPCFLLASLTSIGRYAKRLSESSGLLEVAPLPTVYTSLYITTIDQTPALCVVDKPICKVSTVR